MKQIILFALWNVLVPLAIAVAFSQDAGAQDNAQSFPGLDRTQESKRQAAFESVSRKQSLVLLNLAREYAAESRYNRALELYREFMIRFPRSENIFHAHMEAAEILEQLNQRGLAADYYTGAYRVDGPTQRAGEALLRASKNLVKVGSYGRAIELLEKVQQDFPFSELAKKAELEIKQLRFTGENPQN